MREACIMDNLNCKTQAAAYCMGKRIMYKEGKIEEKDQVSIPLLLKNWLSKNTQDIGVGTKGVGATAP